MSIEANKIFYSGLYSDYINIEHKDENILYFCTDTKQIFKGEIDVTQEYQQVYDKPDNPAMGVLYASSENGTVETYNGTSWVEVFAPIVGTDTIYTAPLAEGETSVIFPMPNEGDVVDIYTDNNAQYISIEVNEATRTRSANNTGSLTVNFTQQEISDIVHMRTYHNDRYTASILASLCIDGISITHPANNTVFIQGDVFDITGLQVSALHNGETIDITNSITTIPAAGEKLKNTGNTTVRIVYGTLETNYSINVISINEIEVTTLPTKTIYETDESLDLTGIVVTGYNNDKTISKIVTNNCKFVPPNGTVFIEEKTYTIAVSYGSLNTSFDVVCQNLPAWDSRGLNYNSWETIQAYIKAGLFGTVASVGQTKSFIVNDKTYNAEVVAINDGTGSAGQWYPNKTVDFITKELYSNFYSYNSTPTNAGGFPGSQLRGILENTIYPLLPNELKDVIANKVHAYVSDADGTTTIDSTKLWLPTQYEISGSPAYEAQGETSLNNKKYNLAHTYKSQTEYDSEYNWWLASRGTNETKCFWIVNKSGYTYNYGDPQYTSATKSYCIPICFRIG